MILLGWLLFVEPRPSDVYLPVSKELNPRLAGRLLKLAWISNATVYAMISIVIYMLPRLSELSEISVSEGAQSSVHAIRSVAGLILFGVMLADRRWHGRVFPFVLCLAACLLAMLLFGTARSAFSVFAGSWCLGLALGASYTMSLFYSLSVPRVKGRGSAAHEGLIGVGYALGPLVGGLAASIWMTSRAPFFAGACLIAVVSIACSPLLFKKSRLNQHSIATTRNEGETTED
jgi:predicted MFS family arabinose efflux permease